MRLRFRHTWTFLGIVVWGAALVGPLGAESPQTPIASVRFNVPATEAAPAAALPHGSPFVPELQVSDAGAPAFGQLPAQEGGAGGGLTLADLEQIALDSNPTLVQARMAIRAAQGGWLQAGLYPNPAIGYAGADIGMQGTSGQNGLAVGQEFVTHGKLRLGRAVAGHQVQQAHHAWRSQQQRVLNDVRRSFYEVLIAQKMIDTNDQMVRIGAEGARAAEQLWAAAEVSRADVLQAQIEAEMAKVSRNVAENRHRAAWRRLAGRLGRPEMEPAPLAGEVDSGLPRFDWDESLSRLWAGSPELAGARAAVQRARCNLALQRAERYPNVEVQAIVKYDETVDQTLADVGVGVELPVFDRNQGNIVTAEAELIAAGREVRRLELELRDRLVTAFEQYATARWQVDVYHDTILPNSKASLDMTTIGYREGELGYLTLLTAQRTYFSVNLEYLAALNQLWTESVRIEGLLLSGGLEAAR